MGPFRPRQPRNQTETPSTTRASAPIGIVLLLAVAVILAGGVGAATFGGDGVIPGSIAAAEPAPTASLSVNAVEDRVTLTHRGGDSLDVSRIELRLRVNGEPLKHQPPVPFFSAEGFRPGPTGAFNSAGTTMLRGGETASIRVARTTNAPSLTPGATLSVTVYVDEKRVAVLETRVAERA